ncbi:MAG: carboxypeptidase M32 [bacterium]|nr:carboxypeptidase M32 [bacterium]
MSKANSYENYVKQSREMATLGSILAHLGWDQQVMLPSQGHAHRQEQMVALSSLLHKRGTDPKWGELINNLVQQGEDKFDAHQWCNLKESQRSFEESTKLPEEIIVEMTKLSSAGHSLWVESKQKNHFPTFAPILKKFVEIRRKVADILYPDKHPYDVCIDQFERNFNREKIDNIFNQLRTSLVPLTKELQANGDAPLPFPVGNYCINKQRDLNRKISEAVGLDYCKARIDESAHPFSGGGHSTDVRITTRYEECSFFSSLSSTVHETGHGMYEQGLPVDQHDGLPVGSSLGLVVHESQSLLMERMICQGRPFWNAFGDEIRKSFPDLLGELSNEELYRRSNRVAFGLIRVDADELTYPLHIILRYEIEKALFDNEINIDELPEAWNAKCHELMGFIPPTDSQGVLQDAHWADGCFGYFPMYTLGAMYGAQFYNTCHQKNPNLETDIATGNFDTVKNWLNLNIHKMGRLMNADELLLHVTGSELNCEAYCSYLTKKYSQIYRLR